MTSFVTLTDIRFVFATNFNHDGTKIISGGADNCIKIWDVGLEKCINTLTGHSDYVSDACFDYESKFIVSGSYDYSVNLWKIQED